MNPNFKKIKSAGLVGNISTVLSIASITSKFYNPYNKIINMKENLTNPNRRKFKFKK